MQVHQLLKTAAERLQAAGVEQGTLEAELLLRGMLNISRTRLFLLGNQDIESAQEQQFADFVDRRCSREPLQYILGCCEFWSLDFLVTPAVLIPRPETEFVLEHVLTVLGREDNSTPLHVLDLCTGSGIIAVVIARELACAAVTAVDVSSAALEVAVENIERYGLISRIELFCADMLTAFANKQIFDVIVSNPPYVKGGDIAELEPEVRDWEPELALSGGTTGMECIETICHQAPWCLKPGGWVFLEIGADLGEPAKQVFLASGRYEQVGVIQDWAGMPRLLQARCIECF